MLLSSNKFLLFLPKKKHRAISKQVSLVETLHIVRHFEWEHGWTCVRLCAKRADTDFHQLRAANARSVMPLDWVKARLCWSVNVLAARLKVQQFRVSKKIIDKKSEKRTIVAILSFRFSFFFFIRRIKCLDSEKYEVQVDLSNNNNNSTRTTRKKLVSLRNEEK